MSPSASAVPWTGYSLAERDRRWHAVRTAAEAAGYDAVLAPLCIPGWNIRQSLESARGADADARYLTMLDNASVLIPTDDREPIVLTELGSDNGWIAESRSVNNLHDGSWAAATSATIAEFDLDRARIGVTGLGGGRVTHVRAADGVANWSVLDRLQADFPSAKFEDATDLIGQLRYVKSDEELDCLRRGSRILESAIDAMLAIARPGLPLSELYSRTAAHIIAGGGEFQSLAFIFGPVGGGLPMRFHDPSSGPTLEDSFLVDNELHAMVGGLIAQEVQPFLLGRIPPVFEPVIELHQALFAGGLSLMRPGRTFGELIDFTRGFGRDHGCTTEIIMHGRGLGNDGPLLTPMDLGDAIRDVEFAVGNVFVWKPQLFSTDKTVNLIWGGNVEVTAAGGVPMSRRAHGIRSIVGGKA